jgi:hypothetical protein
VAGLILQGHGEEGAYYRPLNTGSRFSMKLATPSL